MVEESVLRSDEFKELLYESLLDSKKEVSEFAETLKKQYKKAWGGSDWLEKRLAKEYTRIIIDHMIDRIQESAIQQTEA